MGRIGSRQKQMPLSDSLKRNAKQLGYPHSQAMEKNLPPCF